ncbi:MAG: iron ABC transporter permease [Actinobacteria bacterium]|mgnify:CR=1 FL=1|nr:iron ABC transporter permease [Actinomycetota bacterium]
MSEATESPLAEALYEPQPRGTRRAPRSGRHGRAPRLVLLAAGVVAVASLAPAAYLVLREGFSIGLLWRALDSPSTPELLWHTAALVLTVGAASMLLGVGLAVLVVRTSLPAPRLWIVLFTMPLAVPGFVSAYTWVAASFRYAPSSTAIFGLGGSTLVMSLGLFPYVFLPTVAALRGVDAAQEEVSRGLGRSELRTFLTVTLPQLRVAISAGSLIVVLHVVSEFGALQLLNYSTLTTAIMQRMQVLGSPESARALAVVLVGGAALLLLVEKIARGRQAPARVGRGVLRAPVRWGLGRARWLWALACAAVSLLALGVPLYIAIVGLADGLSGAGAAGADAALDGQVGIDWAALGSAALSTLELALAAGVVATVVGLPISWLYARHPGRFATIAERSVWLAHALPGVIVALALVYLGVRWFRPVYQTPLMLVAAYVVLFLPLAVASQHVGLRAAGRRLDEAAHSLGYGRLRVLVRVTLPLALPGVAAGALFVLLDSAKELTTTLLLIPTGMTTLSTALWSTTNGEVLDFTAAAPYGIALILIGVLPAYLLARRTVRLTA